MQRIPIALSSAMACFGFGPDNIRQGDSSCGLAVNKSINHGLTLRSQLFDPFIINLDMIFLQGSPGLLPDFFTVYFTLGSFAGNGLEVLHRKSLFYPGHNSSGNRMLGMVFHGGGIFQEVLIIHSIQGDNIGNAKLSLSQSTRLIKKYRLDIPGLLEAIPVL